MKWTPYCRGAFSNSDKWHLFIYIYIEMNEMAIMRNPNTWNA